MTSYFDRVHDAAALQLTPEEIAEAKKLTTWNMGKEAAALFLATWPFARPALLASLINHAATSYEGSLNWLVGAMAMQNPNIRLNTLCHWMSKGRESYSLYWPANPYGQSGTHWLYEAGLKNPLLSLLDLEQPGQLADFLSRVERP